MSGFFSVIVRFLHIGSVVGLVGGALYARLAVVPALNMLPPAEREQPARTAQAKYRGTLFTLLVLVVASGLYNGFGPGAPVHGRQWQMWFGIKMLFVLHLLATAVLWAVSPYGDIAVDGTGKRRLLSLVISGFITILIGDYLRYLTSHSL